MYSMIFARSGMLLAAALVACGGGTVLVESTPRPAAAKPAKPVDPPSGTFAVPAPQVDWIPVAIAAGNGEQLKRALSDRKTLALILPSGGGSAALEDQVYQMVQAAAPDTKVVVRAHGMLDKLLEEQGEIPYRVTMEPAGADILGRPYFLPKNHPLYTDWLGRKKPLKGADAMLVVRPFRVDDVRLQQLRKGRRGGCEEMESALGAGLAAAPAFFGSYLEQANAVLGDAFRRHAEAALPFWRKELEAAAAQHPEGSPGARCTAAFRAMLDDLEPCVQGACPNGLKLHLEAGGLIGLPDVGLAVPDTCPVQGMRNYRAEVRDLGARAVAEALPAIDNAWTKEIVRFNALARLGDTMADVCAPRHRRIRQEDLAAAQTKVLEYLTRLAGADLAGSFEATRGQERLAGVGPVDVLARVRSSAQDPAVDLAPLTDALKTLDRCDERGGEERLYQAVVVDVGSSEVLFMGIFFEEELLCAGLHPGAP